MSSRLSNGLQTCLEPRLTESRILRLILAPSKNNDNVDAKRNESGWNFIEALSNTSLLLKQPKEQEHVYVHPSVKQPGGRLSLKSLEMCTESLGSETGSNITQGRDENDSAFSFHRNLSKTKIKNINCCGLKSRKARLNQKRNFPPPLTSMTGASGFVRVKPHREAGKLVLKAVSMPSSNPLFQAERTNGRLTLSVVKSETEPILAEDDINTPSSAVTRNLVSCPVGEY